MRSTTQVAMAARNVGDKNDSIFAVEGGIVECITGLVQWLNPRTMAGRFDIVIARTNQEALSALRIRKDVGASAGGQELMDSLKLLMDEQSSEQAES